MPSEIGKSGEKKPFNFFDYNGVRLQARYDATRARTGRTPHTTIISICSRLSYMPLRALGEVPLVKHKSHHIRKNRTTPKTI